MNITICISFVCVLIVSLIIYFIFLVKQNNDFSDFSIFKSNKIRENFDNIKTTISKWSPRARNKSNNESSTLLKSPRSKSKTTISNIKNKRFIEFIENDVSNEHSSNVSVHFFDVFEEPLVYNQLNLDQYQAYFSFKFKLNCEILRNNQYIPKRTLIYFLKEPKEPSNSTTTNLNWSDEIYLVDDNDNMFFPKCNSVLFHNRPLAVKGTDENLNYNIYTLMGTTNTNTVNV